MTLDIFKNKRWGSIKRWGGGGVCIYPLYSCFTSPVGKASWAWPGREKMAGKPVVFDLMPPIRPFAMINEVIRSVKSRFFCVRLNALASNNNSALHMGIIHRSLVNSQWSDQSDHDTRICFHRWEASKQSLQDTPSFFLSHAPLHFGASSRAIVWLLERMLVLMVNPVSAQLCVTVTISFVLKSLSLGHVPCQNFTLTRPQKFVTLLLN